eukprot:TRINITY_DN114876_c0_g1_i1.p1 TRINITY_DN114876_c0_g1~~TRINITY_DN114876_c0_g1_i1.p1  ORF type:complete len:290 (-),score=36.74 TRINITY_DN114876_c0_g1_i1:88-921(-)
MSAASRAKGLLYGLTAGDRNGGPFRMAIRVAESVTACQGFNKDDIWARYTSWWSPPPGEKDRSFDTGFTIMSVLKLVKDGCTPTEAAKQVLQATGNAGINAAHRNTILAACSVIPTENLKACAIAESEQSHAHELSVAASVACNMLCRALITGKSWDEARKIAAAAVDQSEIADSLLRPESLDINQLSRGGHGGCVFQAAMYFLHNGSDFATTLTKSLNFAGGANYCPVLVGAIGGARWGYEAVGDMWKHPLLTSPTDYTNRVVQTAESLTVGWDAG